MLRRSIIIGLAGTLASCTLAGRGSDARTDRTTASGKLEALIKQRMRSGRIPGMQVAIVAEGRPKFSRAYGLADVEHGVPVTIETVFPINSMTKCFTCVAIMQLCEEGRLELDAPISRYLVDLPESWHAVTVRQAMSHVSGLPDIFTDVLIGEGADAEAWAAVRALPLEAAPGERSAYNQTNYVLLKQIIEVLSGKPFADFLTERQFDVAGMRRVRFGDTFDVIEKSAQPYSHMRRVRGSGEVLGTTLSHWIDDIPPIMRAAAGVYTNADDMARWLTALLSGSLLSDEGLAQMWTETRLIDGDGSGWALGWLVIPSEQGRVVAGIGGGRNAMFVYPDRKMAVVVLTNLVGANPHNFLENIAQVYGSD